MRKLRKISFVDALLEIRPGSFLFRLTKQRTVEPVATVAPGPAPGPAWSPNAPQAGDELRAIYFRSASILPLVIMQQKPATWLLWFALAAYALLQLHTVYRAIMRRRRPANDSLGTYIPEPVQSHTKRLISLEAIEAGIQNLTWHELYEQKKQRGKLGDRKIEGRIRNLMQKHWERSLHWSLYREILKGFTPGQVAGFYPSQGTPKEGYRNHSPTYSPIIEW